MTPPPTSASALARRLPALLGRALRRPLAEPAVVALFLGINLAAALVLAVPLRSLLAAELDHNLYGEAMATGASWRWFDTVERRHSEALGDLPARSAVFSAEGVGRRDLAALSGPTAAILLAGLVLYLLHAVLHTGWLATARWKGRGGVSALLHRAGLFAAPTLGLATVALLLFAGAYAAAYVATGPPLARLARFAQSESLHMLFVWLRLGLTVALVVAVKLWLDLARATLVETGSGDLRAAARRAAGELARRGWAYLLLAAVPAAGTLGLAALWLLVADPLTPRTWLGLAILFVLHQLVLAARVVLRLGHLGATQALLLTGPEAGGRG
jgi:hypothetical protein